MKLGGLLLFLACAAPAAALASSAFDGTWRPVPSDVQLIRNDSLLLKDGVYRCATCSPAAAIAADGADHPAPGSPYWDSAAVYVIDSQRVRVIRKQAGREVSCTTFTVSPDKSTLTIDSVYSALRRDAPILARIISTRVGAAPVNGAHAISGTWKQTRLDSFSDSYLTVTYKMDGGQLAMRALNGQSFTAPLDGTMAPMRGDPGVTAVSVRRTGPRTIEETDYRDGKPVIWQSSTVSDDQTTLRVHLEDKEQKATMNFTLTRAQDRAGAVVMVQ